MRSVQLFEPCTAACQALLSIRILQARILKWLAILSSRRSSQARDRKQVSLITGEFFTIKPLGKSYINTTLKISQSVQSLIHVQLFVTLWNTARQASLSITNSRSSPKLMSIESVMPPNHLILFVPFFSAINLSQHQYLSQEVSSLHQVTKVLQFQLQYQSFQWLFRTDSL